MRAAFVLRVSGIYEFYLGKKNFLGIMNVHHALNESK